MATAPPPPPLPPPPSVNQGICCRPTPCPQYAAIPFVTLPVQETSPSPESLHYAEGEPAPPLLIDQNGPQSPPKEGQEHNPSDNEESHPVQETEPTS